MLDHGRRRDLHPDGAAADDPSSRRPGVGAVTCYIKEGSRPGNYMNRFVGFEYITAQAAARRAQNVLGVQACLAGGAQLIAGRIWRRSAGGSTRPVSPRTRSPPSSRAGRLQGQVRRQRGGLGRGAPDSIVGLWKQRQRWSRGNFQVTVRFQARLAASGDGGPSGQRPVRGDLVLDRLHAALHRHGEHWTGDALSSSTRPLAVDAFKALWAVTGFTYLFVTFSSLLLDTETARRCWFEGTDVSRPDQPAADFRRPVRTDPHGPLRRPNGRGRSGRTGARPRS